MSLILIFDIYPMANMITAENYPDVTDATECSDADLRIHHLPVEQLNLEETFLSVIKPHGSLPLW